MNALWLLQYSVKTQHESLRACSFW